MSLNINLSTQPHSELSRWYASKCEFIGMDLRKLNAPPNSG
ncbi:MAG: hypothetical protein ACPG8W_07600 [Candidatus Promineifilaceae bacterium]